MLSNEVKLEILSQRMKDIQNQRKALEEKYVELYTDWYAIWTMIQMEEAK